MDILHDTEVEKDRKHVFIVLCIVLLHSVIS